MADNKPVRRRRRPKDTQPEELTEQEINDRTVADPNGIRLSEGMLEFLTKHPIMAHRRLHFDATEVATLVTEALIRRGIDREVLIGTRFIWVGSGSGCPELYMIRAGIEA